MPLFSPLPPAKALPGVSTYNLTGINKRVWLTGSGTLSLSSQGSIFRMRDSTLTLIIDGPTLSGMTGNSDPVVYLYTSTVELRNGTISGNNSATGGGGVYVAGYTGAAVSGGEVVYSGTLSGNTALYSGGVFAGGGTVYGDNDNDPNNGETTGNTAIATSNIGKTGHAVSFRTSGSSYYRNETLGDDPSGNISTTGTLPTESGQTVGNWTMR